jgi:hypothetical protein
VQVRRGVGRSRTLRARTTATSLRYRAPRGTTLTFRVTATDAAGNRSAARRARTLVLRFRGTGVAVFLARGSRAAASGSTPSPSGADTPYCPSTSFLAFLASSAAFLPSFLAFSPA